MAGNKGLSFYNRRRKKIDPALFREILSWVFGIVTAVFIAAVLNYFLGMSTNVVGASMEPVLYNGQQILINRFLYLMTSPREGDVVVFLPNGNRNSHYYVKRVVAGPGDSVLIQDGVLYVNGEKSRWNDALILDGGIAANELTLGNSEYFCLGDNPGSSEDSRSANIGPVNKEDIIGKAWFALPGGEGKLGLIS